MAGDKPDVLKVDGTTAVVLREAYHKIVALPPGNHYALYDYVRAVAAKIVPFDTFWIGFLHGANRVRYPYGYEGGKYDDPASHTYGPNGQTAWLLKHRVTYRYAYDNGAALNAGVMTGDVTRRSEDAITVPLFRSDKDGGRRLFGMLALQSYQPRAFDDNAVRAVEWLSDLLARVLNRDHEDRDALRRLPAGDGRAYPITSDLLPRTAAGRVAARRPAGRGRGHGQPGGAGLPRPGAGRRWLAARRRACLKTYFVGRCVLAFPNAYRKWRVEQWHRQHLAAAESPALGIVGLSSCEQDPADLALRRLSLWQGFDDIPDERTKKAILLQEAGYRVEEIARALREPTGNVIRGVLARQRRRGGHAGDHR